VKKTIWFIRHGESCANIGKKGFSPSENPLTKNGLKQAKGLALNFKETPSLIIVSKYLRAKQTAQETRVKFKNVPCEQWDVHEFTYLSEKKYRNTNVTQRTPLAKKYWKKSDPFYCDGYGAESFHDFISRARCAIKRLKKVKGNFIVVFTHEQFINACLWLMRNNFRRITGKQMKMFRGELLKHKIKNAGIIEAKL
jgi:broad specificity phosphatase PhoE